VDVLGRPGDGLLVAYFCSEFGVDERLPIYAGGLGVLAGDHLKSSSDLDVPLLGVGLFYRGGYFRQSLDETGWQREAYPDNDPESLGLQRLPVEVSVDLAGEQVGAAVWRLDVGRVPLYLLDSDLPQNSQEGRAVTATLYGGDREQRIRQEVLLGVGGVRALAALGIEPTVFHMNEGHAALLALERIRRLMDEGATRAEAFERVRSSTVFTTHTPVAAGHDVFDRELAERYLEPLAAGLRMSFGELAALGSENGGSAFGMTPLALRTSAHVNGVSSLHGEVSRRMWKPLWPELAENEVPITHITNGVHPRTWVAPAIAELLPEGRFDRAREIDPEELWRRHAGLKGELLDHVASTTGVRLDPDALTVGFARRFATYKRADLLFADRERAACLLADPSRPVQIVLAGKAHPADDAGKEVLRRIAEIARSPEFAGRVVFLEGYDIALARLLVRGADVWLNTPERPLEASGTSGMKAGMNGVLNVSILDGWWAEGFSPEYGWGIGGGTPASDHESLLATLEQEVVSRFYDDRGAWAEMMKVSIAEVGVRFSSDRMVREYVEKLYVPAARSWAAASSGATVFT
jgi:starch phosphorylase